MASGTTARLGLPVWSGGDSFLRTEFNAAMATIDSSPGVLVCTSSTRPVWGSGQAGRTIIETNTSRIYVWDGSAWNRVSPEQTLDTRVTKSGQTNYSVDAYDGSPGSGIASFTSEISFGYTFSTAPIVVATCSTSSTSQHVSVSVTAITTTGFKAIVKHQQGTVDQVNQKLQWIATTP